MRKLQTYTLEELQQLTGISPRTISYYTQEDLLPRVGRLGPRTRYPSLYLDRLNFIRRVRELEAAGNLPTRRLQDIRQAFKTLTDEEVHRIATGEMEPQEVYELLTGPAAALTGDDLDAAAREGGAKLYAFPKKEGSASPAKEAGADSRMGSAASRKRNLLKAARGARDREGRTKGKQDTDALMDDTMLLATIQISELLARLDAQAEKPRADKTRSEKWLRVPINENVVLSVRNLDARHAGPAEKLVGWLKRLLVFAKRKGD